MTAHNQWFPSQRKKTQVEKSNTLVLCVIEITAEGPRSRRTLKNMLKNTRQPRASLDASSSC